MARRKFYIDLIERVLWTFLQTFAATLLVDANSGDLQIDLGTKLVVAATAGLASVLKGVAASTIGNKDSASTASEV